MIIIYRRIKYRRENDIIQCSVIGMDKSNNSEADGNFDNAPYFNFNDGKVKFDTNWFDNANTNYGSASAFWQSLSLKIKRRIFTPLSCLMISANPLSFPRFPADVFEFSNIFFDLLFQYHNIILLIILTNHFYCLIF